MTIKRCYPVLVGASVVENQLSNPSGLPPSGTVNGIEMTNNGDGTITANGTATAHVSYQLAGTFKAVVGHKYYLRGCPTGGSNSTYSMNTSGGVDVGNGIIKVYNAESQYIWIAIQRGVTVNNITYKPNFFDLTQKFGSTIADYIYSLESATAGSGIAWLRSYGFLTDDYVPYNTGSIESVEATAKVVRDENGENAITYPLGSDVLRGIFKLDANNNLYADGDVKTSDGVITRKYGIVDLGSLNWTYVTAAGHIRFFANIPSADRYARAATINCVCPIYETQEYANVFNNNKTGIAIHTDGTQIAVYDPNYTDAPTFKTAMLGVYLVYELATPTTEQSTPFTSPQIVYPDGTEEFVTENGVPVGHETKYQL